MNRNGQMKPVSAQAPWQQHQAPDMRSLAQLALSFQWPPKLPSGVPQHENGLVSHQVSKIGHELLCLAPRIVWPLWSCSSLDYGAAGSNLPLFYASHLIPTWWQSTALSCGGEGFKKVSASRLSRPPGPFVQHLASPHLRTRERAVRCRNQGGMDRCVPDVSFPRRCGHLLRRYFSR